MPTNTVTRHAQPAAFVSVRLLSNDVGIPPLLAQPLWKATGIFVISLYDLLVSIGAS